MKLLIACFVFLVCCTSQAGAGVGNLFWSSDDVAIARFEAKSQRKMHKTQVRHAQRMGVYHSPAVVDLGVGIPLSQSVSRRYSATYYSAPPTIRYYSAPRPVIRHYGTTRYYGW